MWVDTGITDLVQTNSSLKEVWLQSCYGQTGIQSQVYCTPKPTDFPHTTLLNTRNNGNDSKAPTVADARDVLPTSLKH